LPTFTTPRLHAVDRSGDVDGRDLGAAHRAADREHASDLSAVHALLGVHDHAAELEAPGLSHPPVDDAEIGVRDDVGEVRVRRERVEEADAHRHVICFWRRRGRDGGSVGRGRAGREGRTGEDGEEKSAFHDEHDASSPITHRLGP